jgi:biotin carboxyl carrier protein
LVVKVEVEPGDSVARGQGLVIVEAMKMENELRAETEGVVRVVHAQPGQTIEKDQVLIEFESFPQGRP